MSAAFTPLLLGAVKLLDQLGPFLDNLGSGGARSNPLHPSINIGELALGDKRPVLPDHINVLLPREKGNVGVSELVANQELLASQVLVQDASDALDLVFVSLGGAGDMLRVEHLEPDSLAVVGTLSRDLEKEPLLGVKVLGRSGSEAELVVLVVGGDDVLENGA